MGFTSRASFDMKLQQLDIKLPVFEQFLEFVPDAVVAMNGSGEIVFTNSFTEQAFGYSHGELVGCSLGDLLPERFRDRHVVNLEHFFAVPGDRQMGARTGLFGIRADGSEFPAEIDLSLVSVDDRLLAIAFIRDVTDRVGSEGEREQLEAELKLNQSRRLESVGELAGGVAHDFNNLLAVIMNYAEFVSAAVQDMPKVREDIEQIQAAAKRAAVLTRQLLTFSRRDLVKPRPLNVNEILENIEKLLQRTIGEDVHLTTSFEPAVWTVIADVGQLEQIVMNLTVNARDAMPSGGSLEIETQNVELGPESAKHIPGSPEPGRYVRLTVSDTGSGMPPDVLQRAFEPFFTTKAEGRGTGLGLATVHKIVTAAGGSISIDTETGHGTAINIYLPASEADVEYESARKRKNTQGFGEVVMVVEDEPSVRRLVERVLAGNGYEVISFSRANDAVEALGDAGRQIDLLLSDVLMPEMQGDALAAEAQMARPGLPVVFMSGYSETLVSRMDPAEAVRDLIEKPFTGTELLSRVRESLDREAN